MLLDILDFLTCRYDFQLSQFNTITEPLEFSSDYYQIRSRFMETSCFLAFFNTYTIVFLLFVLPIILFYYYISPPNHSLFDIFSIFSNFSQFPCYLYLIVNIFGKKGFLQMIKQKPKCKALLNCIGFNFVLEQSLNLN